MSPECQLLRRLLKYLGAPSSPPAFSRREKVDYTRFLRLVEKHRLGGIFYWELRKTPWKNYFPSRVWKAWEEDYHFQLRRTVLNQNHLHRVLSLFQQRGIEVIILKGAYLAEYYYSHPALRPFDDIDILIRPRDRLSLRATLEEAGLQFVSETLTAQKFALLGTEKRPELFLEVHSNLQTPERRNPSFDIKIDDFWQCSRPTNLFDAPVRVLAPTLNLIYLSAHLSHHGFSRLIWFYDLHLIVNKSGAEISWDELIKKSRSYRSATQVYYSLLWTKRMFGSAVPEGVLGKLSPAFFKRPLIRFSVNLNRILADEFYHSRSPSLLERFLMNDNWPLAFRCFLFPSKTVFSRKIQ